MALNKKRNYCVASIHQRFEVHYLLCCHSSSFTQDINSRVLLANSVELNIWYIENKPSRPQGNGAARYKVKESMPPTKRTY